MPAVAEPVIYLVSALVAGTRARADAGAGQPYARSAPAFHVANPIRGFRVVALAATVALRLALGTVGGLAVLVCPAAAQQFTADLVATDAAGGAAARAGKIYVASGAVRIETPDLPGSFFLVNGDAGSAYLVRPAQQIFMDAKQSSRLTQIFVPVDPENPCQEWQAMAVVAGAADQGGKWHCQRLDADSVAGRRVVKYQAAAPQGRADYGWIDPRLRFPIMFQYQDGTKVELMNIREGPQRAGLFEVPQNSRKFDPQRLIERIKHSDVWVDPPK
jgi:hypothetical protein